MLYSPHLKALMQSIIKGEGVREDFAKTAFKPSPKVLNRVQLGRVRRQEKQSMPRSFRNGSKPAFSMERGVIHDNNSILREGGQVV